MSNFNKNRILPVFIPFLGCPNRCLFCNQKAITGIETDYRSSIFSQIENYLNFSSSWDEIAFFGGSFTCLAKEERDFFYNIAKNYGFSNLRISTRPECFDDEIFKELEENNVKTVEIGVQSTSDRVLELNLRNYTKEKIFETSHQIKKRFILCTQLMTGMFGETLEDIFQMIRDITKIHPHYARIYPTVVLKGSPLEEIYHKQKFIPEPPDLILAKTAILYAYLTTKGIKVIRIGLPESINLHTEIAGGFHHPAMGDIVKTASKIAYILKFNELPKDKLAYKNLIMKLFGDKKVSSEEEYLTKLCGDDIEDNWRFFKRAADLVSKEL